MDSTPVLPMTSVVHTISVSKITSTNASYVQWVTDFSNDVTAEVVADSSFKRLEAFHNLAAAALRWVTLPRNLPRAAQHTQLYYPLNPL